MHERWNRDELYKEVWAEPVQRVAERYGVSGTHRVNAVQIKVQSKFLEAIKVAKTAASN